MRSATTPTPTRSAQRLSDPPTYSAVRAMLAKLEAKGVIRHRAEGLRYVYSPVTSRTDRAEKSRQPVDARVLRRLRQPGGRRAPQAGISGATPSSTRCATKSNRCARTGGSDDRRTCRTRRCCCRNSFELSLLAKATLILLAGLAVTRVGAHRARVGAASRDRQRVRGAGRAADPDRRSCRR